jgi:nucleoid DNA-binding protein
MTLTKENLIQSVSDQVGVSKQQSKALVDALFEQIKMGKSRPSFSGDLRVGWKWI